MSNSQNPYVSPHAIEKYQEIIGPVTDLSALKSIQWGWFNGLRIKIEHNGTIHTLVKFRYIGDKNLIETEAVIITSPSNGVKKWLVKTILTMDHYVVNNSLTINKNKKIKG